ncbi:MAG: DNA polymerase III subunit gamma/tau [Egibacteraceae bacterium]
MAYLSLYRKYRSQTFAEIVGQDHVTTTLAHAIDSDRLHHAYLFTGPRGTGKTSTARILAKSLNCEQGPTSEPCNRCVQCVAITEGSSVDVIEIDAASHGGVDDVRDLRDRVAFAPASARRKVYIVDECHMLSTAGWNAFLKTVEEPPDHVVFVFATTEPHKVLATILSRTQRFDFRRIPAENLSTHVAWIGEQEGLTLEPGTIDLLVRSGDGSARDTLSVLDQVIAYTGRQITVGAVVEVLGATETQLLIDAAELIAAGDVGGTLQLVTRLADAGHDLRQFARDLVEHLRQLLLLKVAPDAGLVETTPEQLPRLQAQAGRLGQVELLRAVELLAECQAQMRRGNTRLPLEIALVKSALPEASGDAAALASRLDRMERRAGLESAEPAAVTAAPTQATPAPTEAQPEPVPEQATPAPEQAEPAPTLDKVDAELLHGSWPALLEAVKQRSRRLHAFLNEAQPGAVSNDELVLQFRSGYGWHAEQCVADGGQQVILAAIEEVLGIRPRLRCVVSDGDERPAEVADDEPVDASEAAAVAETEALEAAGELPDEREAHALAVQALTRDLGATIIDESR